MLDRSQARAMNVAAQFHPASAIDDATLPCITVGGVQVYAYFDAAGTLVISAHFDEAEEAVQTATGIVPVRVTMSGDEVWRGEDRP